MPHGRRSGLKAAPRTHCRRRRGFTGSSAVLAKRRGSLLLVVLIPSAELAVDAGRLDVQVEKNVFEKPALIHAIHQVELDNPQVVESTHPSIAVFGELDGIARVDAKGLHYRIQDAVGTDDRPAALGERLEVIDLRLRDRG